MEPGKIIKHFIQSKGGTVIGLVKELQFMEKPWLLEHLVRLMEMFLIKGQRMCLR